MGNKYNRYNQCFTIASKNCKAKDYFIISYPAFDFFLLALKVYPSSSKSTTVMKQKTAKKNSDVDLKP